MPLSLAEIIDKPNGRKSRGDPLGPLRRFAHHTGSIAGISCRGARMVIGDARPEIPLIIEDVLP